MPKVVNLEERKELVAEAVWSVIARLGLKGATIRNVASECEMSVGSIQHYFDSQNDLLCFSMELVVERVRKRMELLGEHEPQTRSEAIEGIIQMLQQLLPLDKERQIEAQIWLVYVAETASNKDLRKTQRKMDSLIKSVCQNTLSYLDEQHYLAPGVEPEYEAERLYALLDGIALHLTTNYTAAAKKQARGLLQKHMLSLVQAH